METVSEEGLFMEFVPCATSGLEGALSALLEFYCIYQKDECPSDAQSISQDGIREQFIPKLRSDFEMRCTSAAGHWADRGPCFVEGWTRRTGIT